MSKLKQRNLGKRRRVSLSDHVELIVESIVNLGWGMATGRGGRVH